MRLLATKTMATGGWSSVPGSSSPSIIHVHNLHASKREKKERENLETRLNGRASHTARLCDVIGMPYNIIALTICLAAVHSLAVLKV